jgi:beta-N-acetylhexosaminidase
MRLPDDPIQRRRLTALAVVAVLAAGAGAVAGAGPEDERAATSARATAASSATTAAARPPATGAAPAPADAPAGPTAPAPAAPSTAQLQREAGQTVVLRFDGVRAPAYALRALRERRAAGVVLFADNIGTRAQVRAMTRALHRAAGGRTLVMVDQEGGDVKRIPWAAPHRDATQIRTAGAARAVAVATARDLTGLGINVNLAPVADVATWPRSAMRSRAFPGDGEQVGRLVVATVRAYAAGGLLAAVKHFPGFGRATANTDFDAATVPGRGDPEPYRAAIAADVPLVMASHALHPDLDRTRIASQSRRILTGILRDELGFEGACVTDALEARAVVARAPAPTAALRSMRAGCDLLLTTVEGTYLDVLRRLVASARRDPALRARLREARGRIRPLLR